MRHTATLNLEDISVTYSAIPVKSDYGVPGSPVWTEMQDIEIEEVEILGFPVPINSLPVKLQSELFDMSSEVDWCDSY